MELDSDTDEVESLLENDAASYNMASASVSAIGGAAGLASGDPYATTVGIAGAVAFYDLSQGQDSYIQNYLSKSRERISDIL